MQKTPIICVTPNAALDRTMLVPDFAIGRISRIPRSITVPGGKGLNVARALRVLGGEPLAMGLLGGHTGRMVAALVMEEGFRARWTWFEGETRTCSIIALPAGNSTVINEEGRIEAGDWLALADDIPRVAAETGARAICLCGSLPLGAPAAAPADLIARLKAMRLRVWVDSSGPALEAAIEARPYAIKVNRDELAEALGQSLETQAEIVAAGQAMAARGIGIVVVSLGASGALLVAEDRVVQALPPAIQPVDPIASGDCLHAGIVQALETGADLAEALRRGVAAGTVNALYAGGAQFSLARYLEVLERTRVQILSN